MKENRESVRIFLTGHPGIGKTTLVLKLASILTLEKVKFAGFATPEKRGKSGREGFELIIFPSNEVHELASKSIEKGYKMKLGSYYVNENMGAIILKIINEYLNDDSFKFFIGDEVGPMELMIPGIREGILKLLKAEEKSMLMSFHINLKQKDPEIYDLISKGDVYVLSTENRNQILNDIINKIRRKII
ncbi:hypothetical protein IOK49_00600 [Fervidicoccus fontis]|jgi:nucleoside-triphosphatase|uniref:NTPase n=2 Tax=Fervidicoccus fontis TaxID=683846 RepID=I0A2K2_FERFK|nr:nucleoside-triphosphatase [Fervidicoccus fontis]AFH43209.1 hypothetical protein FFONT_1221 [Fervidicoccus fontis Kam940]MBE9390589.1 hypothetical protein [Fervidicoccus fontis]PMB75919.1 MAG: methylmalonyl Co-A mutase-associated GTPase MeaB [Fervidicoccus fontis]PMB77408.1 MAG: methylmalonyl Co-A mutase-associated GTPase MeaB [Fervidicoccus fontis]HEW63898.1 hypothetical protein [Fervidicoccus fontis]